MKKIMSIILVVMMLVGIGVTANAVYNEEENTIDYSFVAALSALGMTPDGTLEMGDSGMIWTRTCSIDDIVETAERLGGDSDINGDGNVYMWYDMIDNIGTLTIVGDFTYYFAEDEEEIFNYYQVIFKCDEYGDFVSVGDDFDEIYW